MDSTVAADVSDIRAMFAHQVSGDIINAWNVGNAFQALHIKPTSEYVVHLTHCCPPDTRYI